MIERMRQKGLWRGVAQGMLFLSLFLLQAYLVRFSIGPYPSNLQEVLVALTGVAVLGMWLEERRWPCFKGLMVGAIFVFMSAVSLAVNDGVRGTTLSEIDLIRNLKFLFFAGVLVFLFVEILRGEKERMWGLRVLGWGAVGFGLWSAVWNLTGHDVTHDYRLLGQLDSAVYLAYYMTPFFIFFGVKVIEGWRRGEIGRWDLVGAVLLGILILATRSMGAIGGSFLVLSWFLMRREGVSFMKDGRVKVAIGVVGVLVVGAIFYTKIWPTLTTEWSSLDERGEIWVTAVNMLEEPGNFVFGVGLSQFEAHYQQAVDGVIGKPALRYGVIQPHNIFLLFWFHYGVLGLVFLVWAMWGVGRNVWRIRGVDVRTVASLALMYMFVHGLLDTPFYKNDMFFLLLFFMQLALFEGQRVRVKGEVVKGEGAGRKLGFPTLNIEVGEIDLGHGVYEGVVRICGEEFKGAVHFGPRLGGSVSFEVHVLDFDGEIYGEIVEVDVVRKVRGVKKFGSLEELKEQIRRDVDGIA